MAVAALRGPGYPAGWNVTADRQVSRYQPPSGCGIRSSRCASSGRPGAVSLRESSATPSSCPTQVQDQGGRPGEVAGPVAGAGVRVDVLAEAGTGCAGQHPGAQLGRVLRLAVRAQAP